MRYRSKAEQYATRVQHCLLQLTLAWEKGKTEKVDYFTRSLAEQGVLVQFTAPIGVLVEAHKAAERQARKETRERKAQQRAAAVARRQATAAQPAAPALENPA